MSGYALIYVMARWRHALVEGVVDDRKLVAVRWFTRFCALWDALKTITLETSTECFASLGQDRAKNTSSVSQVGGH